MAPDIITSMEVYGGHRCLRYTGSSDAGREHVQTQFNMVLINLKACTGVSSAGRGSSPTKYAPNKAPCSDYSLLTAGSGQCLLF